MVRSMQKLIVHVAIFIVALLPLVTATQKHTKNTIHKCNDHKVLEVTYTASPILSFNFIVALLPLVTATQKHTKNTIHKSNDRKVLELTPKLSLQIILHGFLLWASMGFLMPIAILLIRMPYKVEDGKRLKMIVYTHASLQVLSVLLVAIATIMSVINFENFFDNTHQRLGLALYVAIWLPLIAGIFRPDRGIKNRGVWYAFHWLIGVAVTFLGIVNVYIGLQAYNTKTMKSIRVWNWLFSAEVAVIALIYLFQEKWHYIKQSGGMLRNEPVRPTYQEASPTQEKELPPMA